MKTSNLEDLTDWLQEHKLTVFIGICAAIALGNLAFGGSAKLSQKLDKDAAVQAVADQQATAEQIFNEQSCSAQFLNQATNKLGLAEGAIAIDPVTGSAFSGGYLCSPDGSLWQVNQGGSVHFVGTSPNIRKRLIESGTVPATAEMSKVYAH